MTNFVVDRGGNDMGKNRYDIIRVCWIERDVSQWAIDTVAFESLCAWHRASIMYQIMDLTTY